MRSARELAEAVFFNEPIEEDERHLANRIERYIEDHDMDDYKWLALPLYEKLDKVAEAVSH